jgi:uncharacterized protein YqgC (DUF456 family)
MLNIAALTLLILLSLTGFAAIFFTTFGTLIILAGAIIYALITGLEVITLKTLLILLVVYAFGELIEYFSIIIGAKKFGASNAAVVGAIVGAIPGAVIGSAFFGIGIIFGTFLGIFLGAFLVEFILQRDLIRSLKAGTGGILGRLGSILGKVIIALIMFWIIAASVIGA